MLNKIFKRWQKARTIAILSRLDDDTLKDIGVQRGMITGHVNDLFSE